MRFSAVMPAKVLPKAGSKTRLENDALGDEGQSPGKLKGLWSSFSPRKAYLILAATSLAVTVLMPIIFLFIIPPTYIAGVPEALLDNVAQTVSATKAFVFASMH